jgi:hypothetical protein
MREPRDDTVTPRLIAVAALGVVLIVPPLLSGFDKDRLVFGVPLLWLYLFGSWALVVGLVAFVASRSGRGDE